MKNFQKLKSVFKEVENGELNTAEALKKVADPGYEDIGVAKIDHDRAQRKGFPEVVLCEGKTTEQVVKIMKTLSNKSDNILASRAEPEVYNAVKEVLSGARYNKLGRMIIREKNPHKREGKILIISAGTSDLPVVEEAYETASVMGNKVEKLNDAGVAGVHRLLNNEDMLHEARVIIVVAGMDGALPSVVAGLVGKPVIAVPTSVGYGANLDGMAPLLTMLNSCASGLAVVNIDNGFGAAYMANSINKMTGLSEWEENS
ncbi:MAG: nickel pincer cofactor biosynthesis protein LarB [Halanaerobiales bacterium]